jgi:hypothetical protein
MTSVDVRERALTLREVARRLDEAGVVWAVLAGAAASAYGATRPITDVDILVALSAGDRVAGLFPGAAIVRQEDGAVRSVKLPDIDLIAGLTMVEGEVAYTVDLDDEMAARRTVHEIGSVMVPVIPPEDNMLLKAVWGRGPEQGKHDWEDVEAMMAHLPAIDWGYLRWRAAQCGPTPGVRRAVKRLREIARRIGVQLEG